jgi:hypothetical protein
VARYLFATHLLDTIVAVVDTKDLLAPQQRDADDEDVLADEHVSAMKLSNH